MSRYKIPPVTFDVLLKKSILGHPTVKALFVVAMKQSKPNKCHCAKNLKKVKNYL